MATLDDDQIIYDVVIVGAGITGLATAIGLIRRGVSNILVLEKATALHPIGASIAIFSNGLRALEYISPTVATNVRQSAIPITTMVVKNMNNNVIREKKPPTDANVSYLVWYLLQQYLAQELPEGILQLGISMESFHVEDGDNDNDNDDDDDYGSSSIVTITGLKRITTNNNETTTTTTIIRTRILVGTDGIHSPIRQQLFGTDVTRTFHHGKIMYRAVLPLSSIADTAVAAANPAVPPTGINVTFQADDEQQGKLFSYRETSPGILTVTAMARFDDDEDEPTAVDNNIPLLPVQRKEEMCRVFKDFPTDVQRVLEQLSPASIHIQAIHDIDVLDGAWSKGPIIVIGDAAHCMSPAMGQGANIGLEDAAVLVHLLSKYFSSSSDTTTKAGQQQQHNTSETATTMTTTTMQSTSTSNIASVLHQVYLCRIERVKVIHAASRARSINNNNSSSLKPIDMTSTELKRVLKEINSWTAPID